MWNHELFDKIEEIWMGQCESVYERNLVRNYMVFYGLGKDGNHYDIGFANVMDYRYGRKKNPFVLIEYTLTNELVYKAA